MALKSGLPPAAAGPLGGCCWLLKAMVGEKIAQLQQRWWFFRIGVWMISGVIGSRALRRTAVGNVLAEIATGEAFMAM